MKASAVLSEKQYSENLKKQVKAINSILEGGIKNIEVLTSESMFAFLHADTRWTNVIWIVSLLKAFGVFNLPEWFRYKIYLISNLKNYNYGSTNKSK